MVVMLLDHVRENWFLYLQVSDPGLFFTRLTSMICVWTTKFPPMIWLQVICCIGIAKIALAALMRRPRALLITLGVVIVCGHNTSRRRGSGA